MSDTLKLLATLAGMQASSELPYKTYTNESKTSQKKYKNKSKGRVASKAARKARKKNRK